MTTSTIDYNKQIAAARRRLPDDPAKRKLLREKAGMSQMDVARELGITPSAVSEWERGKSSPSGYRVVEYVELLVKKGALKALAAKGKK